MREVGEFAFIAQSLAPLAAGYDGAFGLTDDAALIASRHHLVITTDTLVAGVHFRTSDPLDLVARKALRVNLSDLAAMGAQPHAVLCSLLWPDGISNEARQDFVSGLAEDLGTFSIPLIGGDTTTGGDRLVVTITALGDVETPLLRSGARPGDRLFVSGTIGDGGLGLISDTLAIDSDSRAHLNDRYLLPQPRLGLIAAVGRQCSAALDVSDGLIADAWHIAKASEVGLDIMLNRVPVSNAAQNWIAAQADEQQARIRLATAGDDYELLMCVSPAKLEAFLASAEATGCPVTGIGQVTMSDRVRAFDHDGKELKIGSAGFTHF